MAVLFPPLKGVVILNRLKCNILNIVIAIKLSYYNISKYRTYHPGLTKTYEFGAETHLGGGVTSAFVFPLTTLAQVPRFVICLQYSLQESP